MIISNKFTGVKHENSKYIGVDINYIFVSDTKTYRRNVSSIILANIIKIIRVNMISNNMKMIPEMIPRVSLLN
jgi:hypothetical protein